MVAAVAVVGRAHAGGGGVSISEGVAEFARFFDQFVERIRVLRSRSTEAGAMTAELVASRQCLLVPRAELSAFVRLVIEIGHDLRHALDVAAEENDVVAGDERLFR